MMAQKWILQFEKRLKGRKWQKSILATGLGAVFHLPLP